MCFILSKNKLEPNVDTIMEYTSCWLFPLKKPVDLTIVKPMLTFKTRKYNLSVILI